MVTVSGINHGANIGDDITYSGTVAAALEGIVLAASRRSLAFSQQSRGGEHRLDRRTQAASTSPVAAPFVARRSSDAARALAAAAGDVVERQRAG